MTAGRDRTAKVWDAATYAVLFTLEGHTDSCVADFGPDSDTIVTASRDGTARLWKLPSRLS